MGRHSLLHIDTLFLQLNISVGPLALVLSPTLEREQKQCEQDESHGHGETPTGVQNTGPWVTFKTQSSPRCLRARFPKDFSTNSDKNLCFGDYFGVV